jgi:uncharacterized membrane protein (UPF0127 family)
MLEGRTWTVEVAMTAAQRYAGLGGRTVLPEGTGMLFVYPDARPREYSMRGCNVPLDMAFLDSRRHVVHVQTMPLRTDGGPLPVCRPPAPAQYVLEVAAGELARANVTVGSLAEFSDSIPNPRAAEPWP